MYEDPVVVRQGKLLHRSSETNNSSKHIVFDLDETLGSFRELYKLCEEWMRSDNVGCSLSAKLLPLLHLFPEFLRPGILTILQCLHHKKKQGKFKHFYIYTNNQCGRMWTESLVHAIQEVAQTPALVDHIICAFKIDNKIIDSRRTTHWKTWKDFVRCTLVPSTAQICFIDDTYFPKMNRDRVFYLQPRPYTHPLSWSVIAQRWMRSFPHQYCPPIDQMTLHTETTGPTKGHNEVDEEDHVETATHLLYYIGEFFELGLRRPSTRKERSRLLYNLSQKRR